MTSTWLPTDWQVYAHEILTQHYGPANWIRVPDQHTGDAGIEGFSTNGHAYQCYAPQGTFAASELHDRHRKKIYVDTTKFINNRTRLEGIFGNISICRWILFVPEHLSADIVAYCNSRRQAIIDSELPYVSRSNFLIKVSTADDFPAERRSLAMSGIGRIGLDVAEASPVDIEAWTEAAENALQIGTLRNKLDKLPTLRSDYERRRHVERNLLKTYLHGRNVLHELKSKYPKQFEEVRSIRASREGRLDLESQLGQTTASRLVDEVDNMVDALAKTLPAFRTNHHSELGLHAVADWLMRCPLDFVDDGTA